MAERLRLFRKFDIELIEVEFRALELRPGVLQRIGAVDLADQVFRQSALTLVARKGFEGRRGKNPAEIPDHGLEHRRLLSGGSCGQEPVAPKCVKSPARG